MQFANFRNVFRHSLTAYVVETGDDVIENTGPVADKHRLDRTAVTQNRYVHKSVVQSVCAD